MVLDAGANFASSPSRILIHCLDLVFVCERIAYTNFEKIVPIQEVIENTITGLKGVGRLQTRGTYTENRIFPFANISELRAELLIKVRKMAANERSDHPWKSMNEKVQGKGMGIG